MVWTYRRRYSLPNQVCRRFVPWCKRRDVRMHNSRPMVSFTFDDFPKSALTFGGDTLREFGGAGTYYLSGDRSRPLDYGAERFDEEQLADLVSASHELACHTYSHLDCGLADEPAILADIEANRRYVESLLPGYPLRNFAYPYGNVSVAAKSLLGARFRSCRGIVGGVESGKLDATMLRAWKLYQSTLPNCYRAIDLTARKAGWLILFTHDIRPEPSPFGIVPGDFRRIVEYASRAGCRLLTVDAALDLIAGGDGSY